MLTVWSPSDDLVYDIIASEEIMAKPENIKTGIPLIDSQHHELFRQIDKLTLSIYKGDAKRTIKEMLNFLDQYTVEHFETEEDLMYKNFFPGLEKHIQDHRSFAKLFGDIRKDFEKKGADSYMAIRIEKELRRWWENHILKTDMLYVPYLKEK